jgi:hypothetical protein
MVLHDIAPCHTPVAPHKLSNGCGKPTVRHGPFSVKRDGFAMLKTLAGSVFALALLAGTASSQDVEFRGGGFVTFSGCAGLSGTDYMNFRYRPFVAGQQQGTQFSGFFPFFGFNVSSVIDINSAFTVVNGNTVAGIYVDWPNTSQLKFTTKSPLIIQAGTKRVDLAGEFKNFQIANCNATFRAGLERLP